MAACTGPIAAPTSAATEKDHRSGKAQGRRRMLASRFQYSVIEAQLRSTQTRTELTPHGLLSGCTAAVADQNIAGAFAGAAPELACADRGRMWLRMAPATDLVV